MFIAIAVLALKIGLAGDKPAPSAPVATRPPVQQPQSDPEADSLIINWLSDLGEARALARKAGKDILVAFVCLDGSAWSQRLYDQALSRPAFAAAINKHFVCAMIEFPRNYSLPPEQRKKNNALRNAWDVRTHPTVFLADSNGRPYAVTGYREVGAADYAHHLNTLRAIREKRDQYFASAAAISGQKRAVMIAQALHDIDENILLRHYSAELAELKRLDPQDTTGLIGDIEFTPKITSLRDRVIRLIRQQKDFQSALDAVDSFIEQESPSGEHLQKTLFLKLHVHAHNDVRDHAAIVQLMDSIIAVNPVSEQGRMAVDVRARANALLAVKSRKSETAQ
ncbi:MAG: thioredoxin family protein [Puniceicoccales bacterium]|nr:thioredoxin family protein [Puniceicoccales bacterium]